MSKVTQFRPDNADDRTHSEYEPSDGAGSELPAAPSLRDNPSRLAKAMAATDMVELRAEIEAEIRATIEAERQQADLIAREGAESAQKTIAARGRLRAMGIQCVVEARKLEGRDDQPWTDFDADVAYGAADLFLTACGLGARVRAHTATAAIVATPSTRKLSPSVEAGIAASAEDQALAAFERDPTGGSA